MYGGDGAADLDSGRCGSVEGILRRPSQSQDGRKKGRKDRWKEEREEGQMEGRKGGRTDGRKEGKEKEVGQIGPLGGPVLAHGPHV